MSLLPELENAEVFFGDTEKPLPNWRDHSDDEDIEDDAPDSELAEKDHPALVAILGFDPFAESEGDSALESYRDLGPENLGPENLVPYEITESDLLG